MAVESMISMQSSINYLYTKYDQLKIGNQYSYQVENT